MNKTFLLLCVCLVLGAGFASAALDDAEAYYAFDEGSGSTAIDSSGNNNDGTIVGASYVTGKVGSNALSFGGDSEYVYFQNSLSDSDFSVSFWVNPSSIPENNDVIVSFGTNSTSSNWFTVRFHSDEKFKVLARSGFSGNSNIEIGDYEINEWYHIVVTREGQDVNTYLNSILTNTNTNVNNAVDFGSDSNLGRNVVNLVNGDMVLDEFAIYPFILSSAQVSELYNGGTGFNPYAPPSNDTLNLFAEDVWSGAAINNFDVELFSSVYKILEEDTTTGSISIPNQNVTFLTNTTLGVTSTLAGLFFRPDGTQLFVTQTPQQGRIQSYSLSTPWDITTATTQDVLNVFSVTGSFPKGLVFSPDGSRMYVGTRVTEGTMYEYSLSTPWDITTGSYTENSLLIGNHVNGIHFNNDGTIMFALTQGSLRSYSLSTPWDLSTATLTTNYDLPNIDGARTGVGLWMNSTHVYINQNPILTGATTKLSEYVMSTPYDLSTISLNLQIQTYMGGRNIFINPSINSGWIMGAGGNTVRRFVFQDSLFDYDLGIKFNSDDYFSRTYNELSAPQNFTAELVQSMATFTATDVLSNSVTDFNVTIDNTTLPSTATWNLSAGTYNATFSKSGWYNLTKEVTTEPVTNHLFVFDGVYNHILNLTLNDLSGQGDTDVFAVNITSSLNASWSEFLSTTNGTIFANLIHGDYLVTLQSANWTAHTYNVTLPNNTDFTSYVMDAYTANSFLLEFRNETTNEPLDNVTAQFISTQQAFNQSTSNGTMYVDLLTPGEYEIRYWHDPSVPRSYFVTLTPQSFNELTLYSIEEDLSSYYIPIVTGSTGQPCSENFVSLLRYYIDINGYRVVEMARTDTNGEAVLRAQPNIVDYKLMFSGSCGTFTSAPQKITRLSDGFTVLGAQTFLTSAEAIQGASINIDYLTNTQTYVFDWNDPTNIVNRACLVVKKQYRGLETTAHNQCSDSNVGSLIYTLQGSLNDTVWSAQGIIYTDTEFSSYGFRAPDVSFLQSVAAWGVMGLFWAMIVVLGIVMLNATSAKAIVFSSIGTLAVLIGLGVIAGGGAAIMGLVIIGVIMLYKMRGY